MININENRKNYKKTKVGWFPNNWKIKNWREVLVIQSGKNQKAVINPKGKYPILGSAGKIMDYADDFICDEGTTIIGRKGTIDKPLYIKTKFWNVDTAFGLIAGKTLDKKYLYYFCLTFNFKSLNKSTSLPSLVKTDLYKIKLSLPPLPEQKKIAEILSAWDSAIEQIQKLIEAKKRLKKGLMQKLLTGKIRFPEFVPRKTPKTRNEENNLPEGWDIKKINDIADVKGGKRLPKGSVLQDEKNQYPYIRVSDMYNGGVDLENIKYIPKSVFPKIKNYRIYQDDIFITVAGTLGVVGVIPKELDGANLTENADKLTKIKCNKIFLLYMLTSSIVQKHIEAEKTSNAQPKLALTKIKRFSIPFPTLCEQKRIASILSSCDSEIEFLEKEEKVLREQKKGLMQKLLTGAIRTTN